MIQLSTNEPDAALSFATKLVSSESFKTLFRDGMTLVEETAAYLDGDGREDAKKLPRLAALAYATESMRLTTRLMQTASWLLLQRAVNEGELTQTEAASEKRKVRLSEQQAGNQPGRREEIAGTVCLDHRSFAAAAKPHPAPRSRALSGSG